jgi:hypothetical protein
MSFSPELETTFIWPYSNGKVKKRNEIWSNLQKGLLLEDKKTLIHWETPFNQLDNYKEKRNDKGDRTEWYFGKHKILDGLECHLETMMWIYLPWTNPFERISENLGYGIDGYKRFQETFKHLSDLLGEPTKEKIEFEDKTFFEGSYEWTRGNVSIRILGFDMHGSRYMMKVGLNSSRNDS